MAWLLRDGEVLASLEVLDSRLERGRGLLGRERPVGAVLLPSTRAVHTIGMRYPLDIAFCDEDLVVVAALSGVRPFRVALPRRRCRSVIEAEAGSFARWRLQPGDRLEIKG